jgi:hypothetical protein
VKRIGTNAAIASVVLSLLGGLRAQMQWSVAGPSNANLVSGLCTYDSRRDRIVSWGSTAVGDFLFEFDGQAWVQSPVPTPTGLLLGRLAFDRGRARTVLMTQNLQGQTETWEWDGQRWFGGPVPRPLFRYAPMTYHAGRHTAMMFGGILTPADSNELWEWNGQRWRELKDPNGPPQFDALGRTLAYTTLTYDEERDVLVVFGATAYGYGQIVPTVDLAVTWEWHGPGAWQEVQAGGPVAPNRAIVFDAARRTQVVMTNDHAQIQLWERRGSGPWVQQPTPPPTPGYWPIYDRHRGRILTLTQQFMQYAPVHPATYDVFAAGCQGSQGTPSLSLTAPWTLPWIGDTMSVTATHLPLSVGVMLLGFSNQNSNGVPLPLDLGAFGLPGCDLRVALDQSTLLLGSGGQATYTLPIPDDPALRGLPFYNQVVSLDPGANAFGATMSDAATAVVGSR